MMPGVSVRMLNMLLAFWRLLPHTEIMISENHQWLQGLFPELCIQVSNSAPCSSIWKELMEERLVQLAVAASWSRDLTRVVHWSGEQ